MTLSGRPMPAGDRYTAEDLAPIDLIEAWSNPNSPFHTQARKALVQVNTYMQVWDMSYAAISCYFAKWLVYCAPGNR